MVSKILLVNPYTIDIAAYDLWNKPIGLLYLASILKKNGITIDFIDLLDRFDSSFSEIKNKWGNTGKYHAEKVEKIQIGKKIYQLRIYGLPKEIFREKLKKIRDINMILLTSHITYWYKGVLETARILKEYFPNIPIILGGNGAILDPSQYEKSGFFDKVFSRSDLNDF